MMTRSAIVAAVAFLAVSSAQAVETWQFDHVSFSGQDGSAVTLLSQSTTATVVSMDSMAHATTLFGLSTLPYQTKRELVHENYSVNVTNGYRVTGLTMQFNLQGILRPAQPNGYAYNRVQPMFQAVGGGMNHTWHLLDISQVEGAYSDSATMSDFTSENFSLNIWMQMQTTAVGSYIIGPDGYTNVDPSSVDLWADNITFTIHTVPVPEPSTYLMLGAGLGLIALGRRTRRWSRHRAIAC
ncbi:PEP-CTERM sorting domain-containing protein [Pseudoduganella armeniaca]|nr:PEP-CTERM sorting domain-containing protein [Pseudoduganella armeniaca]